MRMNETSTFSKIVFFPIRYELFDVIKISASLMQRMKKRSLLETRSKLTF